MTSALPRTLSVLAALGLSAALFAGCSGGASPAPTGSADGGGTPTPAPTDVQPKPSADPTATIGSATCDSIVVPDIHSQLTSQGWSFKQTDFTAGGVTLPGGFQCTWADYNVAAGGNLMLFGWAPITEAQARTMKDGLIAEGWIADQASGNSFITEDPMQALSVDDDGYGMTYQFGDGWVTVADTKQNLLLIQRPQS